MPRVYVGRLSYQVRERDLERFFRGYGKLLEVDLKNGYGFVEFEDSRDADDAVYELNGKELCGERVIVEHARGPRRDGSYGGGGGYGSGRSGYGYRRSGREKYGPPVRTEFRLIVENLSSRCSWQDLKDFMRQAGEVTYADAHKQHMNEGVIEFRSYSDMKRALDKLDGSEINGRKIRLVEDRPRNSRRSSSGSRSRSRSRSRRHSRSRSRRSSRSRSGSGSKSRSRSRCEAPDENSVRPILWTTDKSAAGQSSKSRSRSKDHSRSKSKSQERKSRSRSISKAKSDKRSRSRSPSRSKSALNNKSHSRSPSPKVNGKGDAKSVSRSRSKSRSRSRNKSTSPVKTKPKSENRSRSRSRSVSRSRSRSKD